MAALTPEILIMLVILVSAIAVFATEVVRIDVAAICIMILIGLLSYVPGLKPFVDSKQLFIGFSSNAVVAIIAVMIIGKSLDKTGILNNLAHFIIRYGSSSERKILFLTSSAAGAVSGIMQNIGTTALFIPVVSRISSHTVIPISRLLMPVAFCTMVGGTITMVGCSPLILLNDLLPNDIQPLGLFDVTPIGLSLLFAALIYFPVASKWTLVHKTQTDSSAKSNTTDYFKKIYNIEAETYELEVPLDSPLTGKTVEQIEAENAVRIIAAQVHNEDRIAPARDIEIEPNSVIAVLAGASAVKLFIDKYRLIHRKKLQTFAEQLIHTKAGISEVVIPPYSNLIGKTVGEIWMRKTYGLSVINIHRGTENFYDHIRDIPLQAGDTLVCHSDWQSLGRLINNRDFIVVTTDFPHEELRPHKFQYALLSITITLGLIILTDMRLSIALMTGAITMILSGVIKMDEAYQAISWKTVFLLASLIPLGMAMQNTGTAAWIAGQILGYLNDVEPWVLQATLAILATFFSLTTSNIGATVLLVPLAVSIAISSGGDPRLFALTTAVATSNAFLFPTQQVNALIMAPGNYTVKDFMRAGFPFTIIFIIVLMSASHIFY